MIYYFSATGNSKYVAEKVQERFGGELCDMAKALQQKEFEYSFEEGGKATFVFPVYYGGLPKIVAEFIANMQFKGPEPEICGIMTFGSSAFGADRMFRKAIKNKGMNVRAVYDVKMVENCVFVFKIPIKEAVLMTLKRSDSRIKDVLDAMEYNHRVTFKSGPLSALMSHIEYSLYEPSSGTKKFWVTDDCIGCGLCQTICPVQAITMDEGKPVWTKAKCVHCAGCIHRCPPHAIQYGKGTLKRNRYVNPNFR